jgi:hypothetical protein
MQQIGSKETGCIMESPWPLVTPGGWHGKLFLRRLLEPPVFLRKQWWWVGKCKSCGFYVDSGHPVADEKSRDGWFWHLGVAQTPMRALRTSEPARPS